MKILILSATKNNIRKALALQSRAYRAEYYTCILTENKSKDTLVIIFKFDQSIRFLHCIEVLSRH